MARIKMHTPKAKLTFYLPCEVKCRLQNGVSTLISLSKQFAPGSSSIVLITSVDSQIRVVDGIDLVHKFKGINKIHQIVSSFVVVNFLFLLFINMKMIHEIFVINLVDKINIIVPPKVDAFLHFPEFSMVLSLCKVLKIALNVMAMVLHGYLLDLG